MVYEYVATTYQRLSGLDAGELERRFAELEARPASSWRPTASRRTAWSSSASPTAATSARATSCASTPSGRDRRRLGREDPRRVPRHPRARVLAPLRGLGHRDPEHPRARGRPDAAARDAGDRAGRRSPRTRCARSARRGSRWTGRSSRSHAVLRARRSGGQPDRGPGDRQPVRLDHGGAARARRRDRPLRKHRDPGRARRPTRGRRGAAVRCDRNRRREMSVARLRGGTSPGHRRASGSRSTRSPCECWAARSTRSPRRWRASCSGCPTRRSSASPRTSARGSSTPRAASCASRTPRRCTSARCPGTSAASSIASRARSRRAT